MSAEFPPTVPTALGANTTHSWLRRLTVILGATVGVVSIIAVAVRSQTQRQLSLRSTPLTGSLVQQLPTATTPAASKGQPRPSSLWQPIPSGKKFQLNAATKASDRTSLQVAETFKGLDSASDIPLKRDRPIARPDKSERSQDANPPTSTDNPANHQAATELRSPRNNPIAQVERPPDASDLSPQERSRVDITLQDAVVLALQNNRDIKNAYLQRIIDRQDLRVAEDAFNPNFSPEVSVFYNRNDFGSDLFNRGNLNLNTRVSLEIPTGTRFNLDWGSIGSLETDGDRFEQNLLLEIEQPLLQGAGRSVNLAPIRIARVQETSNVLTLKATLINTITNVIFAYRSLLQAQESLDIQERSLESARDRVEFTQALIDAGRRARVDIIESQASVARLEVDLLGAENNLDAARVELLQLLDLDENLPLFAAESPTAEPLPEDLNSDRLIAVALNNQPSYLQTLLEVQIAEFNVILAKDAERWELNLNARYLNDLNDPGSDSNDIRAGIVLRREFGDLDLERQLERSLVFLQQRQNDLSEAAESLKLDVRDRIRDVQLNFQQVQVAQRSRELAEERLANEQEKLRLGVEGIRLIDIVNFEDDLVAARNAELNATINYLNAIAQLEQTVGITLERWSVTIEGE